MGPFYDMSAMIPSQVSLPVFVAPTFTFHESSGRLNVKVGPKQTMGKIVSGLVLVYVVSDI